MFKKLLVAAAIIASSNVALAANGIPYVGASIGVTNTLDDNIGGRNANINIFGGYGSLVNQNIYLGGEVFANKALGDIVYDISNRFSYGASFIPGVLISEHTMLYGRAGLVNASYNGYGYISNITGLQAGLGIQTSLTQKVDLRAEYVYSNYEHAFNNDFKPTTDQVNLGLVYKFE
jgi:opacity protein-like surface antigen